MAHHFTWRRRLAAAATACATLTVTLALLAGIPWLLWTAVGIPWPEHVASLGELGDRLMQPVTDPLMLDLLAMVGWACWAAFAATVIREAFWYAAHLPQLVRSRRAHEEHLATLSVKNSLAALCVGTLVVALIGLWRPQAVAAHQPGSLPDELRLQFAVAAPIDPTSPSPATSHTASPELPAQAPTAGPRPAGASAAKRVQAVRHVTYTVVEGDNLWDIAHQHLGDALKWPRIYKLNKDRVQHDGRTLTDPDVIRPGWELMLPVPDTATPADPAAPAPSSPAPSPEGSATPPSTPPPEASESAQPAPAPSTKPDAGSGRDENRHSPDPPRDQDPPAQTEPRTTQGPAVIGLGQAGLIGITAAAGLLAARRYWHHHQRRRHRPGQETPAPALSPHVDKAAQAAHAARLPRDEAADALVTRRMPPQPPQPVHVVTIGERDGAEIPLDELALPGGCTWTGPGAEAAARALLAGILTAAERQRPHPAPHVTAAVTEALADRLLPGLPEQFTALACYTDTTEVIRAAEQHQLLHARTQREQDTDVLTAPDPTDSGPPTPLPEGKPREVPSGPGTLVLLVEPRPVHLGQLQALAAHSHANTLIVVSLEAELPGSTRFEIAADGTTHSTGPGDRAPNPLRLFHVTLAAGRDLLGYLLAAHGRRPRLRSLPDPAPPQAAEHAEDEEDTGPSGKPADVAAGEVPAPLRTPQEKAVRLHVLGPVRLYARGNPDPVGTQMRPEAHEFLALLAAHPAGLLAADIAEKLRLDEENVAGALKNLRRAVRRTLREATGISGGEFIVLQGELHKLNSSLVETDLADFTHAVQKAAALDSSGTLAEPLAAMRQALAHYQGPFARGADYIWADTLREHLTVQATDTALRLAHRAEHGAAPAQRAAALALLEHLGTLHPDHEGLAQHTIRLHQAVGRHDAARHTYQRLQRHLAELGIEPDPATHALIHTRTRARQTR
ncbi:BTAD domain-containing putative transcriptional regulator [Streptomyces sp. NPDC002851]